MDNISTFFKAHNFNLIIQDSSKNFGDKLKVFADNSIAFRISSSCSFNSIDVCSLSERDNWFDLALLRAFLYRESKLNKPTNFDDSFFFLKKEIETIKEMFNLSNYPTTKLELQKLEEERVKQMFSGVKYHKNKKPGNV